jgi:hypothetical protein
MSTNAAAREEEAPETEPSSGRPVAKFTGSGGLTAAVWKHKSESGYDNYSIRLDRSYMGADGNYQTTPYLRDSDLLRAQRLLEQADEWIEQDKGRGQRPSAGGQQRA